MLVYSRLNLFDLFLVFWLFYVSFSAMIEFTLIEIIAYCMLLDAHLVRLFPPKEMTMSGPLIVIVTQIVGCI
jgi:hypothetical protein